LRRAFEMNKQNIVEVIGPRRSGAGVVVAETGEVLTSVDFVGLSEARVRLSGEVVPARVVMANADLKVAMVTIQPSGHLHACAVDPSASLAKGNWIWGIRRHKNGSLTPVLGKITRSADASAPFMEADFMLPPGSPVFDARGRLVALAVNPNRRHLRAVPIAIVKMQLAGPLQ
jgi:hypothetical protein